MEPNLWTLLQKPIAVAPGPITIVLIKSALLFFNKCHESFFFNIRHWKDILGNNYFVSLMLHHIVRFIYLWKNKFSPLGCIFVAQGESVVLPKQTWKRKAILSWGNARRTKSRAVNLVKGRKDENSWSQGYRGVSCPDTLGDYWDLCYYVGMMLLWEARAVTEALSPSYVIRDCRGLRGCF